MRRGFTLIEMLIVISVVSILATSGLVTTMRSARKKQVEQAVIKIETALIEARTNTLSGKKINCVGSGNSLTGWQVSSTAPNTYSLTEVCSNIPLTTAHKTEAISGNTNITISTQSALFRTLGQGVSALTTFTINGMGYQATVDVDVSGRIRRNAITGAGS